jgi:hypothetical protein
MKLLKGKSRPGGLKDDWPLIQGSLRRMMVFGESLMPQNNSAD